MKRLTLLLLACTAICSIACGQEPPDPAFDPPQVDPSRNGKVRWNGSFGVAIVNGQVYQHFGFRPDLPFGKWGVGLDLTFRFDEDGDFKEDEWDGGRDYVGKIYYVRYGMPGDPLYVRAGALDQVTLGYGIVMRRYANTIQYPEIKRIGIYSEGGGKRLNYQAMTNSIAEFDEPGVLAGRVSYATGIKGLTLGGTLAFDGNQFAGLIDNDDDGIPDRLDGFPGDNDFYRREQLLSLLEPDEIDSLIRWGFIPDIRRTPVSYQSARESMLELGADAGLPIFHKSPFSFWLYGQAAKIIDYGWGIGAPGLRAVMGPVEIGAEYRYYQREFRGEYFNLVYEIERAQLVGDSAYVAKSQTLAGLPKAHGVYADALINVSNFGYVYSWYTGMDTDEYGLSQTIYGEAGITPPQLARLQRVAGYYMQPNVKELFDRTTDGTILGAKIYIALANNISLVYDHRLTYYQGEPHRTIRVETLVTF